MRYFVTGATGFVGGHLTRRLRGDGHEVVALVRNPEKARDLVELGVDIREGDITAKGHEPGKTDGESRWLNVLVPESESRNAIGVAV